MKEDEIARGVTTREVTITFPDRATAGPFASTITIPAGTRAVLVRGGMGDEWAVDDIPLLFHLTGNMHDLKHRYAWLPGTAEVKREAA